MKKKKINHSPGPWKLCTIPTCDSIYVWQNGNPKINQHVATTLDYASAAKQASETEFNRCLANAHLIAAAPEMLDLLEQIQSAIKNSSYYETADLVPVMAKIRDVLKKAKGEK